MKRFKQIKIKVLFINSSLNCLDLDVHTGLDFNDRQNFRISGADKILNKAKVNLITTILTISNNFTIKNFLIINIYFKQSIIF